MLKTKHMVIIFFLQPIMADIRRVRKSEITCNLSELVWMHCICSMIKTRCGIDEGAGFFYLSVFLFAPSRVIYVMLSVLIAMVCTFWMNSWEIKWKARREITTWKCRRHLTSCWAVCKLILHQIKYPLANSERCKGILSWWRSELPTYRIQKIDFLIVVFGFQVALCQWIKEAT